MKKLLSVLLVLLCLSLTACGMFSPKVVYELNDLEDGYVVTGINKSTVITEYVDIVIDAEYEGLPVTEIGDNALSNANVNIYFDEVTLPDTIVKIGQNAFGLNLIGRIHLGSGVQEICMQAFQECRNLENLTLPDSLLTVGEKAFRGCTSMTEIVIPASVTTMGDDVFEGCSENLVIKCEAPSQPSDWSVDWNSTNLQVQWGYNG